MDITVLNPVDIVSVPLNVIPLTDVVSMDVNLAGNQRLNVISVGGILLLPYYIQTLSMLYNAFPKKL